MSHLRAESDPWESARQWTPGVVKRLNVLRVTGTRAFGTIEPGIEGFVDLSELTSLLPESWRDFGKVTAGDSLLGCIAEVDDERRLARLQLIPLQGNSVLLDASLPSFLAGPAGRSSERRAPGSHAPGAEEVVPEIGSLLVFDTDTGFLAAAEEHLRGQGITIGPASAFEQADRILREVITDPDGAIVVINSEGAAAHEGLKLIRLLNDGHPRTRILLVSETDQPNQQALSHDGCLVASGLAYKPIGAHELRVELEDAMRRRPCPVEDLFGRTVAASAPLRVEDPGREDLVGTVLWDLLKAVQARAVVLFRIHHTSLESGVEACVGDLPTGLGASAGKWRYSPVKDVAIDKEVILELDVKGRNLAKHRWLRKSLLYESCIGVPVNVVSTNAYCLFTFHQRPNRFTEAAVESARAAAREIASLLTIDRMQRALIEQYPSLVLGMLYGSMAHDLVSVISAMGFSLLEVRRALSAVVEQGSSDFHRALDAVTRLDAHMQRVERHVGAFVRMARGRQGSRPEADVREVIRRVLSLMRDEARLARCELRFSETADEVPRAGIQETDLELVVYNLILNAIRQVGRLGFMRTNGSVTVTASGGSDAGRAVVELRVTDTGPGIHRSDFERVFAMGYDRELADFGMRLEFGRRIVEGVGGRVRILDSILLAGTAVEVLLPATEDRV